jgi:hypothetical protein
MSIIAAISETKLECDWERAKRGRLLFHGRVWNGTTCCAMDDSVTEMFATGT